MPPAYEVNCVEFNNPQNLIRVLFKEQDMQHCSERINAYQSSSSFARQNWFLVGSFLVAVLCLQLLSGRASAQGLSAVETAELGVNTLLATALESISMLLSAYECYFSAIGSDIES